MVYEGRHLPYRLKKFRKSFGYTQEEIREELGLSSRSSISDWEHGKVTPKPKHIRALSHLYQIDPFELDPQYCERLRKRNSE